MGRTYRPRGLDGDALFEWFRDQCGTNEKGCWLWPGPLSDKGYVVVGYHGASTRLHILMFKLSGGVVPYGYELDHTCRNRHCIRPKHCEPVTHAENVRRGELKYVTKDRYASVLHCPQGHPYAGANLYIDGKGHRRCRACAAEAQRLKRIKKAREQRPKRRTPWRV